MGRGDGGGGGLLVTILNDPFPHRLTVDWQYGPLPACHRMPNPLRLQSLQGISPA